MPEGGIYLDKKFRLDANLLGSITISLFDAAFRIAAITTHVPFTSRASRTRYRVRPPDNADDKIVAGKTTIRRRLLDHTKRLMPDDQAISAGRRPPVVSFDDFEIRAADAERQHAHHHRAI